MGKSTNKKVRPAKQDTPKNAPRFCRDANPTFPQQGKVNQRMHFYLSHSLSQNYYSDLRRIINLPH